MIWFLWSHLNKGTGPYFPYEWGKLESIIIENKGDTRYHIYKVGIEFDWEPDRWWSSNCSVELDPGQEVKLPFVWFRVPVDVGIGAHTYKVGVKQEVLVNYDWKDLGLVWGAKVYHILIKESPPRNFEVFLSHSNHPEDKDLLKLITELLVKCGIDVYIAEQRAEPGVRLWSKLENKIKTSNAMLVLWTKYGATSGDVREEIGIAVGARKYETIIPIAEVDLKGSLKGKEYAPLDRENPKKQ